MDSRPGTGLQSEVITFRRGEKEEEHHAGLASHRRIPRMEMAIHTSTNQPHRAFRAQSMWRYHICSICAPRELCRCVQPERQIQVGHVSTVYVPLQDACDAGRSEYLYPSPHEAVAPVSSSALWLPCSPPPPRSPSEVGAC